MLMTVLTVALAAATPAALLSTADTASAAKADTRRYCLVDEVTGSRLPMKTCRSRRAWSSVGIDVTRGVGR